MAEIVCLGMFNDQYSLLFKQRTIQNPFGDLREAGMVIGGISKNQIVLFSLAFDKTKDIGAVHLCFFAELLDNGLDELHVLEI